MKKILAIMTACLIISSCGLKGKLYLEENEGKVIEPDGNSSQNIKNNS